MIVSPFTPLFFKTGKSDGLPSCYMQTFSTTDRILLELIGSEKIWTGGAALVDYETDRVIFQIEFSQWVLNPTTILRFSVLSLNPGTYYVSLSGIGNSEPFRVTDDPVELGKTTLIQYSMKNNRQRNDAVFVIDGMQYFFEFRVPGGFSDSGWAFAVDNEQFTTPYADISQLYGLESIQKRFTLGWSRGVPVWFGEMLNRLLTCSHVYFDGVRYSRVESNVPEMTAVQDGVDSFVFSQMLQQSMHLDPLIDQESLLNIRRIDNQSHRRTPSNILRKAN
ncbi:MAG: hypothetical protein JFR41_11105 [Muribaculaceae bacterium]|nr:hypothetical protein [Muribaculaceae bacterium]